MRLTRPTPSTSRYFMGPVCAPGQLNAIPYETSYAAPITATPGAFVLQVQRRRVARLVDTQRASAGKREARDQPPAFGLDLRAGHALRAHFGDERLDVFAHQEELLGAVDVRRMHSHFSRGQLEDQPVVPGIDVRVLQHVTEELSVGAGILAVEHDVRGLDHGRTL